MTTIEALQERITSLETIVRHLSTHHDENFLMVDDDVTADTCERLFNLNLQQARRTTPPLRQRRRGVRRQT
ncbi:MAG TPA: hypothetical protein VGO08_03930 [Burkholderiales bacterium]|jgi:hypothetical protein|nr:hypothetical protein [Burkholderiales bacterium]